MKYAGTQISINIGAATVRDHANGAAALEDMYDAYAPSLYRYALSILGSPDDAEDAVQEVFIRLARECGRLRGIRNIRAYVLTATRNAAYSILRARRRSDSLTEALCGNPSPSVFRTDGFPVQHTMLREALAELPVEQREVLVLKAFEGMTFREIADMVGASISTITSRYQYGIAKLRRALEDQDG